MSGLKYQLPGVYSEPVAVGRLVIEAVSGSTAAFVGAVPRGPVGVPVPVTSVADYAARFGEAEGGEAEGSAIRDLGDRPDWFGHAVTAFFANGGTRAYIVRVARDAVAASAVIGDPSPGSMPAWRLTAIDPGAWGNGLVAQLDSIDLADPAAGHVLMIGTMRANGAGRELAPLEIFQSVSLDPVDVRSIAAVVARESSLVTVAPVSIAADRSGEIVGFSGGDDGAAPTQAEYAAAFARLGDAAIIVLPGQPWTGDGKAIGQTAIAHAESMLHAMVILDPPDAPIETSAQVAALDLVRSSCAAIYHPWLEVANPYADRGQPKRVRVPPSAAMAGLWARTEAAWGISKAPAGMEATIRGVIGPVRSLRSDIQDDLNRLGVNCIRSDVMGSIAWGARTLAMPGDPKFRYIPVRRLHQMIARSVSRAMQAMVFEPNDAALWAVLRASVHAFLVGLWRHTVLHGSKASDAFFVRCGLGKTMTQSDVNAGVVIVEIGFAPLRPAEFVILRVRQIVGQAA